MASLTPSDILICPQNGQILLTGFDRIDTERTIEPNEFGTSDRPWNLFDCLPAGNFRYTAPEVLRGAAPPNVYTDRYVLAVLAFMLLCMAHPLEGKRLTDVPATHDAQMAAYAEDPLFIMDPESEDNAPVLFVHDTAMASWACLPFYVRALFVKAFGHTALAEDPTARPKEIDRFRVLTRFRNDIGRCPHCKLRDETRGAEIFRGEDGAYTCDVCGKTLSVPFYLEMETDNDRIAAMGDTRLYRIQVESCRAEEALDPILQVTRQDPDGGGALYIQNMSHDSWKAFTPSGKEKTVAHSEYVPFRDGIRLVIGDKTILIKQNTEPPAEHKP